MKLNRSISVMVLGFLLMMPFCVEAQLSELNFNQLDSVLSEEDRQIVVFVHTSWCKVCKQMEHTSLKNDSVVNLLNQKFYFVSFDAESKEQVKYRGQTFNYKPNGLHTGVHELAEQLATVNGKLNYPTICVINSKNEILFQNPGLMDADQLVFLLNLQLGSE